ncbi:MAG: hypothetical protein OXP11_17650 [Gammaproteobacteria bacterium]|nr:hypothetical protein [Gammaproteobacteria bacterium]
MSNSDADYLDVLLAAIRVSHDYRPKFGRGGRVGLTLDEFSKLYQGDAFYGWFGLDDPMMYAAHKAAGGMTSVYRQIGIGVERLFRKILMDSLGLALADVKWSYEVTSAAGRKRRLHLDGRVPLGSIEKDKDRARFHVWMKRVAADLDVDKDVFGSLKGAVFEVRQGYKSKDSKRQNADISNASVAYTKGYLPCAVILSGQIDSDVLVRYSAAKWAVLTGTVGGDDSLRSTYDFSREVLGYDLAAFFQRNSDELRQEVHSVLTNLLAPS